MRHRAVCGRLCRWLLELLCKLGLLSRVLSGGTFRWCVGKPSYSLAGIWNDPASLLS